MKKAKTILDIRYDESNQPNVSGNSLPYSAGIIFLFPETIHAQGERIARKLRELGFITGDFDHIYINFTPILNNGTYKLSERIPENWLRFVDFGAIPSEINELSEAQKLLFITNSTFKVLELFNGLAQQNKIILETVHQLIKEAASELKILHKEKETDSYRVAISYQIKPNDGNSVAWIEYTDKKTGDKNAKPFLKLGAYGYTDLFSIVNSISVSGGIITLKPRTSFKADIVTKKYKTPIIIPIAEILNKETPHIALNI